MWGSSITFQDYPLEQALDIMAELGFTRVEMWKQHLHRCKTPELRQSFSRLAASRGISMGGLNVVRDDYYRPFGTEQEFQRTLQGLKADVDYALTLGSSDVLVWEGVRPHGLTDQQCSDKLLPRLIGLFREAIAYSGSKVVRFLVEPTPSQSGCWTAFLSHYAMLFPRSSSASPSISATTAWGVRLTTSKPWEGSVIAYVIFIFPIPICTAQNCTLPPRMDAWRSKHFCAHLAELVTTEP
jgi:hypothetical protein